MMIDIDIKILGLSIKLKVNYVNKNADKRISDVSTEESIEDISDVNEYVESALDDVIKETEITAQMRKFEKELCDTPIYDIPTYEDIPPKYQINDDVEIITDKFEKEVEDLYEGRR